MAQQCLEGNTLDTSSTPDTEDLMYLTPQVQLQHVIAPQLRFNCYGYITSWSARTVVDNNPSFLTQLSYQITFTLWRPRNDGSQGNYDLVGRNDLTFELSEDKLTPIDNSSGLVPDRYYYFTFQNKAPLENQNLSFQPGDVVGWNVERVRFGITGPIQ